MAFVARELRDKERKLPYLSKGLQDAGSVKRDPGDGRPGAPKAGRVVQLHGGGRTWGTGLDWTGQGIIERLLK